LARKKKKKDANSGAPSWMVTYSDMVTLLLTFFVLMISMSQVDKVKFFQAVGSLRGALGVINEREELVSMKLVKSIPLQDQRVQRVYKQIRRKLQEVRLNEDIKLVKNRGTIVLRINDSVLFGPGETALREDARPVLRDIADMVKPLNFDMRIEGHTDDTPVNRDDYSNWDLSVDRAVSVLTFFASNNLLSLDRLSASGYGAQRPVVPNDSRKNRALNRRVDLVLEKRTGNKEELPYLINTRQQFPF
jgi:chemotaxis protein MotB